MAIKLEYNGKTVEAKDMASAREELLAIAGACEEKTAVTVVVQGTQRLSAPIVLSGEEEPALKKLSLTFRGEDGLLTSLVEVKGSDFKPVKGKPYYTLQLPKGADGQYPIFYDF